MYSGSLVDLCLETIVDNFPRYNSVFNTTKDDSMKRRFEFLQRKYSFEILSRLSTKGGSLEEYVDLLINKYLKVLDTSWLRNCSWEKVTSKIAEIGCSIEKLFFKFCNVSEETPWQDTICYFPNLRNFELRNFEIRSNCTNLIIKQIAKFCPSIEEIDVGYSAVSSEGVKYLCKNENGEALCRKLKKVCLEYTNIKEDDVKYLLQNLPSLEIIDHPSLPQAIYSLHKHELPSLDNVKPYNITALDLNCVSYACYVDIIKVCLSVCPHLKSLTCNLLKYDDLKIFPELPDLERFNIKNVSLSAINIDKVLKGLCEKLTSLTVTNCTVSLYDLSENCPRIKELDLNAVKFLIDDCKPKFNSLTSLTLDNNYTIWENIKGIGLLMTSSEKLESLTFKGPGVFSSEIKTQILKCCELNPIKTLSFSDSSIEKDFVKELLLKCHTLSSLNARHFSKAQYDELLEFANILPNKPKINVSNLNDSEDEFHDDYDSYSYVYGYDGFDSDDGNNEYYLSFEMDLI